MYNAIKKIVGGDVKDKYFIFDLDGTIVNSADSVIDRMKTSFGIWNLDASAQTDFIERIKSKIGRPAKSIVIETIKYMDQVYKQQQKPIAELENLANLITGLYLNLFYKEKNKQLSMIYPYPWVVECLHKLHEDKAELIILTSRPMRATILILEHFELADIFGLILAPQPFLFQTKESMLYNLILALEPDLTKPTTLIGDSVIDMEVGTKLCINTRIGVTWGYGSEEELAKEATHIMSIIQAQTITFKQISE